jgi:2-amino-4-deoxychorismate synthase
VGLDGRPERVGFYNTFVGRVPTGPAEQVGDTASGVPLPAGVAVECDPRTGDVHLVGGPHFRGIQFHAESILTEHGSRIIRELMLDLVGG